MITSYEKPGGGGGRPMKCKVISQFGFSVSGRDVYSGELFETDEYTGRVLIRQGRAVEVEPEPSPESLAGPGKSDAGTGEGEEQKPDEGEGEGKPERTGRRGARGQHGE